MTKSTVALQPVPQGTYLINEGDHDAVIYRVEGGRLQWELDDQALGTAGMGAVVGGVGVVLDVPQLFSLKGLDKASFVKKQVVSDLGEILKSDDTLFGALLASLEQEECMVRARSFARELGNGGTEEAQVGSALEELTEELSSLLGGTGTVDGSAAASAMAQSWAADTAPLVRLGMAMRQRVALRVKAALDRLASEKDPVSAALEMLKVRAERVASLCSS